MNHDTSKVQGECRAELARAMLSRSLYSPMQLVCNCKDTTSGRALCPQNPSQSAQSAESSIFNIFLVSAQPILNPLYHFGCIASVASA